MVDNPHILLFIITGFIAGSTMGMVTYRLPLMILKTSLPAETQSRFNLWLPASHCCHCMKPLNWYDNIPLLSWLCLRGKCRYCCRPISVRYLSLEAVCPLVALACCFMHPTSVMLAMTVFLYFWFALALSIIDLQHFLLPDKLTLPLLWLGLLFNARYDQISTEDAIIGAVAGYTSLWLVYWMVWLTARKEGIGFGDVKLLAAAGAWTGWQSLPVILFSASLIGLAYSLILWTVKRSKPEIIPFGPSLALSGWGYFCWLTL
ncbi:prepilin peptidase [Enterobacter bugandensis]|uniref:prepilin peptidase n=1 Tax=Enterobacter bugandensis TaxID=881260 RepID=UPI0021D3641D|nr:A24 family peptidase [Enterobacter bugandensis]MCU6162847.1 A24 family peptidase [Enterobacter bugandensis]MCU6217497.1 A24 family peptidase [Enterobacter bugandensis]